MNTPLPRRIDFLICAFGFLLFFSSDILGQTAVPGINRIEMLAVAPGENIIAAGVSGTGKNADFVVTRLKPDFTIDPTFGRGGIARIDAGGREHLYGLAVQPDGKIITAGFTQKGKKSDFALTRLTSRGELDGDFGRNGLVITDIGAKDEIHFIALTTSGSLVAAGFVEGNNNSDFVVVRYRPNGLLDLDFGNKGIVRIDFSRTDRLYGLGLGPDGKIVAVGSTGNRGNGAGECVAVALTADGNPDENFGTGGMAVVGDLSRQNVCSSLIVLPDGKILVAGYAENGDLRRGNIDFMIARLLPDGRKDKQFGFEGMQFVDFKNGVDAAHALALDPAGRIVVAGDGNASSGFSNRFVALTRLLWNGRLDARFGHGGKMTIPYDNGRSGEVTTMTVIQNGRILVGGSAGTKGTLSVYPSR